jgi:hypothetical protein
MPRAEAAAFGWRRRIHAGPGRRAGRRADVRGWARRVTPAAAVVLLVTASAPASVIGQSGSPFPDFDGDGFADLAVGAPYTRAGAVAAGATQVLYGSGEGLQADRRQVWRLGRESGLPGTARRGDLLGWAVAAGDFDADGFTDLATSARWRRVGDAWHAGVVFVLRGGSSGLDRLGAQVWSQDSPGIRDGAERLDAFGTTLVAADFDADGYADLAIGAPMEDLRGAPDAGVVHVLYGSPDGLTADGSQVWDQASPGVADRPEARDQLGRSLTAGDFDGDGYDDLVIGVPYEGGRTFRMGIVHVLRGSSAGLTAAGSQVWGQDSPGIAERAEMRDQFGQSIAVGDFDGDGYDDLIAGAWFEDFRNRFSNEGGFHVIYGTRDGLAAARDRFWQQDLPGVADRTQLSDNVGQALGVGDLDGDGYDDLGVGIPSADLTSDVHDNQGAVHVFYGSSRGLDARRDRYLTQDSPGVLERAERFDHLGEAVTMADVDADGFDDLIVATPWEDGRRPDEGVLHVLPGGPGGVSTDDDRLIRGSEPGTAPPAGARFGWSMTGTRPDSDTSRTSDPEN